MLKVLLLLFHAPGPRLDQSMTPCRPPRPAHPTPQLHFAEACTGLIRSSSISKNERVLVQHSAVPFLLEDKGWTLTTDPNLLTNLLLQIWSQWEKPTIGMNGAEVIYITCLYYRAMQKRLEVSRRKWIRPGTKTRRPVGAKLSEVDLVNG
ncbi:hypothetical protein AVEN_226807-1 [Araneus ventricosus]|uniref:Uncharacterized protein n=1 Tax=Araneus ventricosus TaxID=182803 RepID=A0A4Y2RPF3_ARAVE|nr:hypothetical protein AVEN_226807-1 [Araneus ventricosus]